jgi:hypothetical protein
MPAYIHIPLYKFNAFETLVSQNCINNVNIWNSERFLWKQEEFHQNRRWFPQDDGNAHPQCHTPGKAKYQEDLQCFISKEELICSNPPTHAFMFISRHAY